MSLSEEIIRHQMLFIGGLHRSGTSPLFACLRAHPQISGFDATGVPEDEGQHLQSVYPTARAHGGPGFFGFDDAAHLTEASELATPENAERLFGQWSEHWNLNQPWLLEKSPPNLIRGRFLQALFPESGFVMLVRHPAAVALATRKWSRNSLDELIRHWIVCHRIATEDAAHIRRLRVFAYEDFAAEPDDVLGSIYEFCGLKPHAPPIKIRTSVNARYFRRWERLRESDQSRDMMARLIDDHEETVRAMGYSLVDLDVCDADLLLKG